jgi:hypothetical protein
MATLWWMTSLGNEGVNYGDFNRLQQQKQRIGEELTRRGFSDVRVGDVEISASKEGCLISIAHLSHPSPNRWWEVIICSCDGSNVELTRNTVSQAFNAIRFTW